MSWWLGAGLGFLRGGPLGALIGGAAQHWITKKTRQLIRRGLPGVSDEGVFAACIVVVMTKVAWVKGHLTSREVETIYRFFTKNLNYSAGDLEGVNRIIRETCRLDPDFAPVVERYRAAAQSQYRNLLLVLAYQVALVEGPIGDSEQKEINRLAECLGLSYGEHDRVREKYSLGRLVTPYSILGVSENANAGEIKRAYWHLAARWHPDKAAHLGREQAEEAHLRFLEIQEAYRKLEQLRTT